MRIIGFLFVLFSFTSCSTANVSVSPNLQSTGKKIGIGTIDISAQKKGKNAPDSVCTCIVQSLTTTLIPYLHKKGYTVVFMGDGTAQNPVLPMSEIDYLLTGSGQVHVYGSSNFVEQLTLKLEDADTREVALSASFAGTSIRPVKAAKKIGEEIAKKIK